VARAAGEPRAVQAAPPIEWVVRVPGSKSLTNRALVLASMAAGRTRLGLALRSQDTDALTEALSHLGVSVRAIEEAPATGDSAGQWPGFEVEGRGGALPGGPAVAVNLGDGGTPTRFVMALAAFACRRVTIDGSARMRERPVAEGVEMLRALGARAEYAEAEGRLPVRVRGGGLAGGRLAVGRTASSQFVSALMLVAPSLPRGLEIEFTEEPTSASYMHLSLAALAAARVEAVVEYGPVPLGGAPGGGLRRISIAPQPIEGGIVEIEPDASSAVYPAAAAVLTGGRVELLGTPRRSVQPDSWFLDDLALRGARVDASSDGLSTVVAAGRALRGLDADYSRAPDAAVMAMVLAACGDRPSHFTGLSTLRVKESDRIASVAAGLRALGGTVETGDDWARVYPLPARAASAAIDTANDHRIAMAFAVLGLSRPGVSIKNPGCVAKSWPGFWGALERLAREPRLEVRDSK